MSSGVAPTPAGRSMFIMLNFHTFTKYEVKHNGIWGRDIYFLDGWGIYGLIGCAIYGSNGWDSYGKVSYCSFGRNAQNTSLQGSTLSSHAGHGFGSIELPTSGLLQKGWDHFMAKARFEWRAQLLVGIHIAINFVITKQIGQDGWSYQNTN